MTKRILLFRHGEIEGGTQNICAGSTDAFLDLEGIRTSLANIEFACRQGLDYVVTSGKKRTRLPGIHLQRHEGIRHVAVPLFNERDFGAQWEGKRWADILRHSREEVERWLRDPLHAHIEGAEPAQRMRERVLEGWLDVQRDDFDCIALWGHSLPFSTILNDIEGAERWQLQQRLSCMHEVVIENETPRIVRANEVLY